MNVYFNGIVCLTNVGILADYTKQCNTGESFHNACSQILSLTCRSLANPAHIRSMFVPTVDFVRDTPKRVQKSGLFRVSPMSVRAVVGTGGVPVRVSPMKPQRPRGSAPKFVTPTKDANSSLSVPRTFFGQDKKEAAATRDDHGKGGEQLGGAQRLLVSRKAPKQPRIPKKRAPIERKPILAKRATVKKVSYHPPKMPNVRPKSGKGAKRSLSVPKKSTKAPVKRRRKKVKVSAKPKEPSVITSEVATSPLAVLKPDSPPSASPDATPPQNSRPVTRTPSPSPSVPMPQPQPQPTAPAATHSLDETIPQEPLSPVKAAPVQPEEPVVMGRAVASSPMEVTSRIPIPPADVPAEPVEPPIQVPEKIATPEKKVPTPASVAYAAVQTPYQRKHPPPRPSFSGQTPAMPFPPMVISPPRPAARVAPSRDKDLDALIDIGLESKRLHRSIRDHAFVSVRGEILTAAPDPSLPDLTVFDSCAAVHTIGKRGEVSPVVVQSADDGFPRIHIGPLMSQMERPRSHQQEPSPLSSPPTGVWPQRPAAHAEPERRRSPRTPGSTRRVGQSLKEVTPKQPPRQKRRLKPTAVLEKPKHGPKSHAAQPIPGKSESVPHSEVPVTDVSAASGVVVFPGSLSPSLDEGDRQAPGVSMADESVQAVQPAVSEAIQLSARSSVGSVDVPSIALEPSRDDSGHYSSDFTESTAPLPTPKQGTPQQHSIAFPDSLGIYTPEQAVISPMPFDALLLSPKPVEGSPLPVHDSPMAAMDEISIPMRPTDPDTAATPDEPLVSLNETVHVPSLVLRTHSHQMLFDLLEQRHLSKYSTGNRGGALNAQVTVPPPHTRTTAPLVTGSGALVADILSEVVRDQMANLRMVQRFM